LAGPLYGYKALLSLKLIGLLDGKVKIDLNNKSKNPIVFIKKFGFTYDLISRILASTDKQSLK